MIRNVECSCSRRRSRISCSLTRSTTWRWSCRVRTSTRRPWQRPSRARPRARARERRDHPRRWRWRPAWTWPASNGSCRSVSTCSAVENRISSSRPNRCSSTYVSLYPFGAHCCHMGTAVKHLVPAVICNFWHPGTLTLRAERQSARMSKITNDGLTRSGTGCFLAVPIWQQWAPKCYDTLISFSRQY